MKNIEVVAAVIVKDNLIFCAQRPDKGEVGLKWEFPGGKVESGETKEDAIKREIFEELDSEISVDKFIATVQHQYNTFHITMHVFKCSLLKGNLAIKEHIASKWVKKEDLKKIDFAPVDVLVLDKI